MKRITAVLGSALLTAAFCGSAFGATLSVQTATNKLNYGQSAVVTVKSNAVNGTTRITTSKIRYANVTIKNPSGTTLLNGVAMSKDSGSRSRDESGIGASSSSGNDTGSGR